jgi:subtilisin family serine protease
MVHRFRFPTVLALAVALIALGIVSSGGAADAASSRTDVIIGFKGQPGPAEQALVQQAGGSIKYTYHLVPAIAASVPEAAIAGLQANPNVTNIDLDIEVHAIDAELDNTWGVKRIGAGTVHDGGNKGAGVKVGVLDTGIDTDHPDLSYDPSCSASFVSGQSLEDGHGHGTHTAGTVAALDNGTSVVGVAPEATLCIYKALSNSGSGSYSDVIAALERAVTDGVQVTNNSYGSSGDPGSTVKAAFDGAEAAGVLHVAAAGNSGNPKGKGNNCIYPARWDSLIATAATKQDDSRASFSSTCSEMELAAPGYQINSTVPGGYGTKSGTSMASPHVAGTAALVFAANPGWSNDQVRTQLQTTADDLGDPGRDKLYGYGLVDADESAPAGPPPPPNDAPTVPIANPADGSIFDSVVSILFEGTASDTEDGDLTASLVWTSNIDGQIGTGGSFSTTLSDGNHTISASVTDSGGKTGSASISITVGDPPAEATSVSVTSIDYAIKGPHLYITVALVDDFGNPVGGASVSITLSHELGSSWPGTGTSGEDGTVTWRLRQAPSGCYTTGVTNVNAAALTWDGGTPDNEFCK